MKVGVMGGAKRPMMKAWLAARLSHVAKAASAIAIAAGVFAADLAYAHPLRVPHAHLPAGVGGAKFVRIGSKSVADNLDRDVIRLPGRERVYQVKLCVRGRAVRFLDFDVQFGNKQRQGVPIRDVIRAGECTRNIDLVRAPRNLDRVILKYTSVRKQGPQPIVDVYARIAVGDVGNAAPPRTGPRRNFTRIGTKVVADRVDVDTIELPGKERLFQIKLCARYRPVEFLDLDVRFANGRNQDIRVRRVIQPGTCTRNIDLVNAPRNIRRIVMKYTSFKKAGLQPVVEVFAR